MTNPRGDTMTYDSESGEPMVFSINREFVEMFRRDEKAWEFRTRCPSVLYGETVLIYETAPTSKIVAEATVGDIVDGSPRFVWDQVGDRGGISLDAFDRYFAGRSRAVAISLRMRWLAEPVPLPAGMSAPQSWARYKGTWP